MFETEFGETPLIQSKHSLLHVFIPRPVMNKDMTAKWLRHSVESRQPADSFERYAPDRKRFRSFVRSEEQTEVACVVSNRTIYHPSKERILLRGRLFDELKSFHDTRCRHRIANRAFRSDPMRAERKRVSGRTRRCYTAPRPDSSDGMAKM